MRTQEANGKVVNGIRWQLAFCSLALLSMQVGCATGEGIAQPDAFPGRPDSSDDRPDAALPGIDAPVADLCQEALAALHFSFESGGQNFVHAPMPEVASSNVNWRFDHWEQGEQSDCPDGNNCYATNLGGNYIQCQRAYLVSPPIDLSACAGREVRVNFQHSFDFWAGVFSGTSFKDGGFIELSGDGNLWQQSNALYPGTIQINPRMGSSYRCVDENNFYADGKSGFVGDSGGWKNESFVIPSAMNTLTFQMRFIYSGGVSSMTTSQEESMSGTGSGWAIDDIRFEVLP